MQEYKVSFPHIGSYWAPMKILFEEGLEVEYVIPPAITKRTLELGSQHSPDYACTPFKYTLGNFLETAAAGANTLVQAGGVCRLGFYGELHAQILRDLGLDVRFINFARVRLSRPLDVYNTFKEINPQMSLKTIARMLPVFFSMLERLDDIEDFIRRHSCFQREPGCLEAIHEQFLTALTAVRSKKELRRVHSACVKQLRQVPLDVPKRPLRVGIVGEYYTIMEPFSNHFIERELGKMGIVIDRWMNITNSLLRPPRRAVKDRIKPYAKYDMGATSMYTINKALEFAKKKYDGIIHVKSFGCTPEIDAMPALQNISSDYKIPILYFSFDTQTADAAIQTRLEAFYDMMVMRNEAGK